MANKFEIVISAVNQASGPISQVQRSVTNLGKQINHSQISKIGSTLQAAFKSPASGISSMARFLPSGPLLAIAAITELIVKVSELEGKWASSVNRMNNLGIRVGLPGPETFGVQYAARLSGLTPEQANGGIEQVRQTYSDALNNRNPDALKRYQAAGISTNPARMESIESVLTKLAAYAETLRQQGKYGGAQNFLRGAGAAELVDFLDEGPRRVAEDLRSGQGLAPTQEDLDRAREYARASAQLSITYDKLKNTIGGGLEPYLNDFLRFVQILADEVSHHQSPDIKRVHDGFEQFGNALRGNGNLTMEEMQQNGPVPGAVGAIDPLERLGNWLRGNGARTNAEVAREPNANVPRAIEYFEAHGSTPAQAYGKTANLIHESALDPAREGDNGKAYGIAQWHADRQAEFEKWSGHTIRTSTLEEQLGFVDHELRSGREQAAGSALDQAQTPRQAADIVSRQFERPANADAEAVARAATAERLAAIYAPQIVPAAPATTAQGATTGTPDDAPSVPGAAPQAAAGPVGRGERMKVEIVHRNPPPGTRVNVSGSSGVDAILSTDRQQSSLGEQYAYSPGAF